MLPLEEFITQRIQVLTPHLLTFKIRKVKNKRMVP